MPSELQLALESPYPGVREGGVGDLARLLTGTNVGLRLGAREALKRLLEDDSRRVSAAAARALDAAPDRRQSSPGTEPHRVETPTKPPPERSSKTDASEKRPTDSQPRPTDSQPGLGTAPTPRRHWAELKEKQPRLMILVGVLLA